MTRISRMTDLATFIPRGGYETSVAQSEDTVIFTANDADAQRGNVWAAYSLDGGRTFTMIDPAAMVAGPDETLCCDQVVLYVPPLQKFVWVLQTLASAQGENSILLATASKSTIARSKGQAWERYRLTAQHNFGRSAGFWLDHSRLAFSSKYLYYTSLLLQQTRDSNNQVMNNILGSVIARFDLQQLIGLQSLNPTVRYRSLRGDYAVVEQRYVAPIRGARDRGYFAAIRGGADAATAYSQLRVWAWEEDPAKRPWSRDVDIETIPTEDYASLTPDGGFGRRDWIGDTTGETIKWEVRMMSGARRGDELWVGWNGARRVSGERENAFPHPHIGLAVIDANTLTLRDQHYIWNENYAYTYPTLEVNRRGDVAMTYCSGGGERYVQHGVGFVSDPIELRATTSHTNSYGGGGHFMGIQPIYPEEACFAAAGHIGVLRQSPSRRDPVKAVSTYYVRFSRNDVRCDLEGSVLDTLRTGLRRFIFGLIEFAQQEIARALKR